MSSCVKTVLSFLSAVLQPVRKALAPTSVPPSNKAMYCTASLRSIYEVLKKLDIIIQAVAFSVVAFDELIHEFEVGYFHAIVIPHQLQATSRKFTAAVFYIMCANRQVGHQQGFRKRTSGFKRRAYFHFARAG